VKNQTAMKTKILLINAFIIALFFSCKTERLQQSLFQKKETVASVKSPIDYTITYDKRAVQATLAGFIRDDKSYLTERLNLESKTLTQPDFLLTPVYTLKLDMLYSLNKHDSIETVMIRDNNRAIAHIIQGDEPIVLYELQVKDNQYHFASCATRRVWQPIFQDVYSKRKLPMIAVYVIEPSHYQMRYIVCIDENGNLIDISSSRQAKPFRTTLISHYKLSNL
jgi:hypothetical protein